MKLFGNPFVPTIIVLGVTCFFAPLEIDYHHDGLMLVPALDVLNGTQPFSQVFHMYGLLTLWLNMATLAIFPTTSLSLRLVAAIVYALVAWTYWHIWKHYLDKPLATAAVLTWIGLAPFFLWPLTAWPSIYALLPQAVALWSVFRFLQTKRGHWLFWAGVSMALTGWFKQNVGVYTALGIIVPFVIHKPLRSFKSLMMIVIGALLTTSLLLTYLWSTGVLTTWWAQTFSMSLAFRDFYTSQYSLLDQILILFGLNSFDRTASIWNLVWTVLPIALVWFSYTRIRIWRASKIDTKILLWLSLSLFSWLQYYPIGDNRHYFWALSPAIGLFFYWFKDRLNPKQVWLSLTIPGMVLGGSLIQAWPRVQSKTTMLTEPSLVAGLKVEPVRVDQLRWLTEHLGTNRAETQTYLNLTPEALLSRMYPNHAQFHPMYLWWPVVQQTLYPDYEQLIQAYRDQETPVILTMPGWTIPGYEAVEGDWSNQAWMKIWQIQTH